ncbi:MAG: ROK family protein [Chitinophagaceae bacterium]
MSDKNSRYKKKIIRLLYFAPQLSCAELSAGIDKSIPLTTRLINELLTEGYLMETGFAPSTGGRRAAMYALQTDRLYIVSVAMDQLVTRIAIMDAKNNLVKPAVKIDLPLAHNETALPVLVQQIAQTIQASGINKDKIVGIGIGMPGFVDVTKGVNYSFLPAAAGKSITSVIEDEIGLPVFIDNDSSLVALAELRFGTARGKSNVMVINIGWGVGLGMIVNGALFRGYNGFAGEFSHIPLFLNNKLCSCGKSGCLETEASMQVVMNKAREGIAAGRVCALKEIPDDYEKASSLIIEAARKGDQFAMELLSETAYNIGRGIAILIHILNPELVVLSGRGAQAGNMLLAPVQQALNLYCIPRLAANTTLDVSTFSNNAELIGAAALVFENLEKKRSGKQADAEVSVR